MVALHGPRAWKCLPNELVLQIITHCVATPVGIDEEVRTTLLLCCHQWARIIESTPLLWSALTLRIKPHSTADPHGLADKLRAKIARVYELSATTPTIIDISLDFQELQVPVGAFTSISGLPTMLDVCYMLHRLIARAQDLTIAVPKWFFPLPCPRRGILDAASVKMLEYAGNSSLFFQHVMHEPSFEIDYFLPERRTDIISVSRLELGGSWLPPLHCFNLSSVKTLQLDCPEVRTERLVQLIQSIPSVADLKIRGLRTLSISVTEDMAPAITLDKLTRLELGAQEVALFTRTQMKKLTKIKVHGHLIGSSAIPFLERILRSNRLTTLYVSCQGSTVLPLKECRTLTEITLRVDVNEWFLCVINLHHLLTLSNIVTLNLDWADDGLIRASVHGGTEEGFAREAILRLSAIPPTKSKIRFCASQNAILSPKVHWLFNQLKADTKLGPRLGWLFWKGSEHAFSAEDS